jgi:hypothetical protein
MSATTAQPIQLSTHVFEQDIPPTIADGIAALLSQDRQIIIVTGKIDGRMSGFLADLTHCITRRNSLLRIKSSLAADELHAALSAQLHLPSVNDNVVQLAARLGQRLQQPAPRGRFVLLCEAADQYPLPTLEAIRQISNYPVSIVLVGSFALTRRLRRSSLRPLRQRITHQLSLNRFGAGPWLWLLLALAVAALGLLWYLPGLPQQAVVVEDVAPPRPIVQKPLAEPAPPVAPAADVVEPEPVAEPAPPDLRLTLDRELSRMPQR